jgi:hypothetical protein
LEATPFVVGAALAPRLRFARYLPSLACGCGGALPAALSLPSLALTWFAFGPLIALLRAGAAIGVMLAFRRSNARDHGAAPDPLCELAALGGSSFAAALVVELLRAHVPNGAISFFAGALAGALMPCGTAGIGAAAAFRFSDAPAAFGLLATSGLLRIRRRSAPAPSAGSARFAYAAIVAVCACFALRGTHGFLNPRFTPLVELGGALCAVAAVRDLRTSATAAPLVPAALLVALIAGSPAPADSVATVPLGLYPGELLAFTGRIAASRDRRSTTTLLRPAILCCRADAQMLALTLDRRLSSPPNAWATVRGVVSLRNGRIVLLANDVRPVSAPADQYLYL